MYNNLYYVRDMIYDDDDFYRLKNLWKNSINRVDAVKI